MKTILVVILMVLAMSCCRNNEETYQQLSQQLEEMETQIRPSLMFNSYAIGYQQGTLHILEYGRYVKKKWQEDSTWFMQIHFGPQPGDTVVTRTIYY